MQGQVQGQAQRQYEYDFPAGGYNTRPRTAKRSRNKGLPAKDKKMILLVILLAGLIGIMVIVSAAYAATINYKNNEIKNEISALEGEVESMQIEIQSANNIAVIEKAAAEKSGMVYAEGDKCVAINSGKQPEKNFAAKLKEDAFR